MRRGELAVVAASALLVACTGDDDVVAPQAARADASMQDATISPADSGARKDVVDVDADAAAPPCSVARATDAGSSFDASTDATSLDGGACAARVVAFVDFGGAPHVSTGGPRPGAWQIGKSNATAGPQIDHLGRANECYLATRPGARYRLNEEAWAELDPIDLRGVAPGCPVSLGVWVWYELELGLDAANVVVSSGGGPWTEIGQTGDGSLYDTDAFQTGDCGGGDCQVFGQSAWSTFAPGSTSWRQARFDLSRFAGQDRVVVRFQFHSDGFANYQGIYLQDLAVTVP